MASSATRCVCADAREPEGYERALSGRRADVLLTDPPYCLLTRRRRGGDERDPKGRKVERKPALRFENVREYQAFTAAWLPLALARLRPGAPVVIWTNFLGKRPILDEAKRRGYAHLAGEFRWAKRGRAASGNEELLRVYEVALVLHVAPPTPLPLDAPATIWSAITGYDDENEGKVWGDHPHHKPFGALEPLVRAYSRPGDCVLDPFAGSGSIPVAAVRLGRTTACLEQSREWADRVTERLGRAESPNFTPAFG